MLRSYEDVLDALNKATPDIRAMAKQAEITGYYSDQVKALLANTGACQFLYPKEAGGALQNADQLVCLLKQAAYIDGSFGWLLISYFLAATHSAIYLTRPGFSRLFEDNQQPIVAGQYQPNGRGEKTEDGFTLTGKWSFASGIHNADWLVAGFFETTRGQILKDDAGKPRVCVAVLPKGDIALTGSWDTTGLRGTGSISYECTERFVPASACFSFDHYVVQRGQGIHTIGILELSALTHGCWALGMAQRVVDEMLLLAKRTVRAHDAAPLYAKETFLLDLARACAKAAAAQAFIIDAARSAQREILELEVLGDPAKSSIRLAATFANEVAAEIAEIAYRHIGTGSIAKRNEIEQVLRDIQTGRQHMMISPQTYVEYARTHFSGAK